MLVCLRIGQLALLKQNTLDPCFSASSEKKQSDIHAYISMFTMWLLQRSWSVSSKRVTRDKVLGTHEFGQTIWLAFI